MSTHSEDVPTGRIGPVAGTPPADRVTEGTGSRSAASNFDVEPVGVTVAPIDHERALADRHALIQLCLYAMDRARSGGVAERIEQGLANIGVHALRPEGQRFDPSLHEAGGAVPTDDPTLEGTVAETEVVGFVDHDRLLRAPIVTVYTRR
ncbi:nucleotide exchange factor GrpE [Saccharomonospora sp.]|uniref:nucleotide exchange factor GrpE n=1 Tax=Saccharomonospora sp. TaxID=33913 RepID=UPI002619B5F3|nr:nucleotide exchange factor GrpE [Saccharomonospora sp.]